MGGEESSVIHTAFLRSHCFPPCPLSALIPVVTVSLTQSLGSMGSSMSMQAEPTTTAVPWVRLKVGVSTRAQVCSGGWGICRP